ncbi:thioesterase family protein [Hymenobacter sp. H14-R3]|uniref:acyl-CoA thioesterase n=1 Tax=Hymenobacter sp. H14-R3 TaxID=3046308 RepID=UPI0024BBCA12|nr:thioesterase family protein [Hymenobacter sp. H14-R3]MDJ0367071.1 thioesterase family protein [Hymenobacter sp. H14-R3]
MDTPAAPTHAYSHVFTVEASDIDQLGHANNVAYVRWVQEVAAAHWHHLYPPTAELPPQVWVVQEHHIRYLRSAYAGDELQVRTWVADVKGASSKRLTRIERVTDGQLLCAAETQWVLLDAGSGRPVRVPADITVRLIPSAS